MPILTIDGVPIAYTDTGAPAARPDAPAIVFGHGLLFGGWMFREQIDILRTHYRCVTIDWRGQGETPPAAGGYDMDTLTGDAIRLIRELGLAPAHWVGLSMGGFVGQRIAARHGHLLRSLTLLDTSAGAEEPNKIAEYKRLALALRLFGPTPILPRVRPHLFGPAFLADPANRAVLDEWAERLRRCDRAAVRKAVLGVADRTAVESEIPSISMPVLILVGADDVATPPARSRQLSTSIDGAQLHVIENCGHTSTLEQPTTITELLRRFLDTVDGGEPGTVARRGPSPLSGVRVRRWICRNAVRARRSREWAGSNVR
ncbi:alpha/beta fold hydrolase [Nocardia jejuensis]|uniref:alpha/beta fold hydrolase n=1 Tax=Nocardia jejuensis TaxID=328049 RepID=UPI0009FD794F|nr:alpha/beta fold hydrolase [Nocardia jejuensis]